MAEEKIIKAVCKTDREILAYVVNFPPGGRAGLIAAETKTRNDLFEKLIVGCSVCDMIGVQFPDIMPPADIVLKNSEWNILKECFDSASWPSMGHKRLAAKIENQVKEAADHK